MIANDNLKRLFNGLPLRAKEEALAGLKSFVSYLTAYNGGVPVQDDDQSVARPVPSRPVQPVARVAEARPVQQTQPAQEQPETQLKKELPVVHPLDAQRHIYRDQLVRKIWSVDLRKELVDRIIAVKESGVAEYEITKIIDRAKEREERDGVPSWKTLGGWCKQKYEDAGVEWTKCAKELEPKPEPLKPSVEVAFRNSEGHYCVIKTRELTAEQALELSDMIEAEEKFYTPQEIKDRITRFAKGETNNQYRYAC